MFLHINVLWMISIISSTLRSISSQVLEARYFIIGCKLIIQVKVQMSSEIKFKKTWQPAEHENTNTKEFNTAPFQQQLIGYSFLRNIWGTYFFERQNFNAEDKIDSINKIVGMMKAQIRLMILNQSKQDTGKLTISRNEQRLSQENHKLQNGLKKMRQRLERSNMKKQEMHVALQRQSKHIQCLQQENTRLRNQIHNLKQAKNKASEQIITLTSRCYDLQRLNTAPSTNSLDQFSANSLEPEDNEQRPIISVFGRKDYKSIGALCEETSSLHSQQDIVEQKQELQELKIDLNRRLHNPMKQSLPISIEVEVSQEKYQHFMKEMKLIKLKTERMIGAENQWAFQRPLYRKTLEAYTFRPLIKEQSTPIKLLNQKCFKRIR